MSDVLEDDTEAKVILTPEQEEKLLAFMETDNVYSKYRDEVILLLETGLRISELCGLTTHIDMLNRVINIDHQLLRDTEVGYYISTPKTGMRGRERNGPSTSCMDWIGMEKNPSIGRGIQNGYHCMNRIF